MTGKEPKVGRALGLGFLVAVLAAGGVALRLGSRGDLHYFGWLVVAASGIAGLVGLVAGAMLSYASKHPRGRVAAFTRSDFFQGDPDD